ncbi:MAG: site-specific DNA-methyltransferase [Acholeplasmataceae bacterium]|nr:site-specific DNA-methyltransferase [Acholeplasmataceae bacterium]
MAIKKKSITQLSIEEIEFFEKINKYNFFCKSSKREIVPVEDAELNLLAKERLDYILEEYRDNIPSQFLNNWSRVKLYSPKGNINNAKALLLDPREGAYDVTNKLNFLTGKTWTKFTCSWFIFNALQSDIKEEKDISSETEEHPATFSPTMISEFIEFFTKENMTVLDPFSGIGSTLVAAKRTNRIGYGIELNPKYFEIIKLRVPEFQDNIFNIDSRDIDKLNIPPIDFSISSPPYWDMLNRSTDGFKKEREDKGLDVSYSESHSDLGNIKDYDKFVEQVCIIYEKMYDLLSEGAYLVIIVKNIKKGGKMYPLAWDMARKLGQKYVLKDEKLWIQDKIGLSPYGYPNSWASNILHHYCLIFRKELK